ncbi:MAG TPA: ABC transporter ATP-binding protein, partial [Novosphingobium sp.]|nr:ABC transporter ATP-binding protein [Novosphingobium sp.]
IINHGQLIANKPTRELVDMAREKVVVLTFDSGVPELPRSPAFLKCERVGERTIEITYDKDSSNAGEVLALVQGQGFGIVDVTTREADLEDVFVRLTSQAAA